MTMRTSSEFETNPHPGRPKVLFVGLAESSHTHAWVGLLEEAKFNVRVFGLPTYLPPHDWKVRTYITCNVSQAQELDHRTRAALHRAIPPAPVPPTPPSAPGAPTAPIAPIPPKAPTPSAPLVLPGFPASLATLRRWSQGHRMSLVRYLSRIALDRMPLYHRYQDLCEAVQIRSETERARDEVAQTCYEAERAQYEAAQIRYEAERAQYEAAQIRYEAERVQYEAALVQHEVELARYAADCAAHQALSAPLSPEEWLAQIIREWRPDIVHTLGLDFASYFYSNVRSWFGLSNAGKWIVQARGGPDLALHRLMPEHADRIRKVLCSCDVFIADNQANYSYAVDMGLAESKICPLGFLPGTGGIDLESTSDVPRPSQRPRLIVWPKAYECPQGKALPVFEGLRLAWDHIQPCRIALLAAYQDEVAMWWRILPEAIQQASQLYSRIPRLEVLELLKSARVLLAPSLSDGIPNSLYEAMAFGVFPIVSPLETIGSIVEDEKHVLFARNLYPGEIAAALIRAMNDDALVDAAAERNLRLVGAIADRAKIRQRVVGYYEEIAARHRAP